MTKETEDLFEYCKAAVRIATKDVNSGLTHFQVSEEKVIKELEELEAKLKKMEVYLTKGGIILDRNGKQCHDGDNVTLYQHVNDDLYQVYRGKIIFNIKYNQLYICTDSGGLFNPASELFELIEE